MGRVVRVTSSASFLSEIEAPIRDVLPNIEFKVSGEVTALLTIVKYGLLDLTFDTTGGLLDESDRPRLSILSEFGFVGSAEENDEVCEFFGNDPTCLESLREDLKAERTTLRLFLEEEPRRDLAKHMVRLAENGGLTEDFINAFLVSYFPKDFVIADACMTNAPFIWFHKHFWM
jgi:hypothetical protein